MSLHDRRFGFDAVVPDADRWPPAICDAGDKTSSAYSPCSGLNPYQQLHRALKKIARTVDKLDLHQYMSLRKLLEQHIGKDARLTTTDMEALRRAVTRLRETYGELEAFLTHWSRHTGSRRQSMTEDPPHTPAQLGTPEPVCDAGVVETAEALRVAVCEAHAELVHLVVRHRDDPANSAGAQVDDDLARYQVHYRYYAALMQHIRYKGLSWFGHVLSGYFRGWPQGTEGKTASEACPEKSSTSTSQEVQTRSTSCAVQRQQALVVNNARSTALTICTPSQQPSLVDISDLCTWVSEVLVRGPRGAPPLGVQADPDQPLALVYQEISARFGGDSDALNNLFYWLLRMQKGGSKGEAAKGSPGAVLDTTILQPPGGHAEVNLSVEHYVYEQVGGLPGALDWLAEAEALGFDTGSHQGVHSRCSSWEGSSSGSRASSRTNSRESSPGHGRGQTIDSEYFHLCKVRTTLSKVAVRVRETAILLHVVYDGKVLPDIGALPQRGAIGPAMQRGPQLLPWDILQRCIATAARVVKHYLAHELPAKYQH